MIDANLQQCRGDEGGLRGVRELDPHHGRRHPDQLGAGLLPKIRGGRAKRANRQPYMISKIRERELLRELLRELNFNRTEFFDS